MKKQGKVFITSNPALMVATMPAIGRAMYLPDAETMQMADYDAKLAVIAERYLDYDVRMITGTTCWFSLLFDKLLDAARQQGRRVSSVTELWPNLSVLIGGGVAAGPYIDVINERLGRDDIPLIDTYNATEGGIYGASDHSAGGAGLLMVPHRGVFYELIPAEERESDHPRRVPLWEVEPGRLYSIVVTTPSGLYAYELGDYVRFPSVDPLRIEFAGRTAGCLSTTQELTTHIEIQEAFQAALATSRGTAVDFSAGADVGIAGTGKSRYVLFAEFSRAKPPADRQAFIRAFDQALCQQNRVYREHRSNEIALLPPEFVLLPEGSVRRFMEGGSNGNGNYSNVQTKFPRIVDDERKELLRSFGGESVVCA
jgi:hypothetical protein